MKEKKEKKPKSTARRIVAAVLVGVIYLLAVIVTVVCAWYAATFDMDFGDLLFVMMSPLDGTGGSTLRQVFSPCLPPVLIALGVYVAAVLLLWHRDRVRNLLRRIGVAVCAVGLCASLVFAVFALRIPAYLQATKGYTSIYEEYYVDPFSVDITAKEQPKNLIYIYVESLETTYASVADGGAQPRLNYMPKLTELARENQSFSDGEGLGGFHSIMGTGWTMGALLGQTSGVPFSLAVFGEQSHNSLGRDGTFMNGLNTLGDVLAEKGYKQEFLMGSDRKFAGQGTYLDLHGHYDVFDYQTAIDEGYIDEDYYVWWGYEDKILYQIARDEVLKLAESGEPFNFTMQTMDTHHVGGYRCSECQNLFDSKLKNVVYCTDRQLTAFVNWCQEQEFYENTTIIIAGDHPRMDTQLVADVDFYDRTVYNCFLNSAVSSDNRQNRVFTSLDLFPTTLAAMGFTIEGDRLGLGVNLFSDLPTLAEERGFDWMEAEVSRYSEYYKLNFTIKKPRS